jgi:hypothetical protein
LRLDSGRQEGIPLLSDEAAKSNARYSQPSGEVVDDGGIFDNLFYAHVSVN